MPIGALKSSLRRGGVNKTKYQASLMELMHTQHMVITKIIFTAKELKRILVEEIDETNRIKEDIPKFLDSIKHEVAEFKFVEDTIREGGSTTKNKKSLTQRTGRLKGTNRKQLKEFKKQNEELERDVKRVGEAVKKDEESLKRVLVHIELLRLLVRYLLQTDAKIEEHRKKESKIELNEVKRINNETNDAVQTAMNEGHYEHAIGQRVEGT